MRASASDTVVSDLIENRLEALARSLLLDTGRSTAQSAFQPTRLAARMVGEQVVDAQPRMSPIQKDNPLDSLDSLNLPDLNLDESNPFEVEPVPSGHHDA